MYLVANKKSKSSIVTDLLSPALQQETYLKYILKSNINAFVVSKESTLKLCSIPLLNCS